MFQAVSERLELAPAGGRSEPQVYKYRVIRYFSFLNIGALSCFAFVMEIIGDLGSRDNARYRELIDSRTERKNARTNRLTSGYAN